MKKLLFLILLVLPIQAADYSVNLQWDGDSTANLHRLYTAFGTNSFILRQTVTNTLTATQANLPIGIDVRFYVTAVSKSSGLESPPSNIVTNRLDFPSAPINLRILAPVTVTLP